MRIGNDTNNLFLGRSEIPVFDYALHNQFLLKNEFLIFHQSNLPSASIVVTKFENHFKLFAFQDTDHLECLANHKKLDLLFFIKSGKHDGRIISDVPCAVHEVFPTKVEQFHGNKLVIEGYRLGRQLRNLSKKPNL